jgi:hypothetical protein
VLIDSVAGLLDVESVALRTDLIPRIRRLVLEGFLRASDEAPVERLVAQAG